MQQNNNPRILTGYIWKLEVLYLLAEQISGLLSLAIGNAIIFMSFQSLMSLEKKRVEFDYVVPIPFMNSLW